MFATIFDLLLDIKIKVPSRYFNSSILAEKAELVLVLLENGQFHRAKVLSCAVDQAKVNNKRNPVHLCTKWNYE